MWTRTRLVRRDLTPRHFRCPTKRFRWSGLDTEKNGTLYNRNEVCRIPMDASRPRICVPEYVCGFVLESQKPPNRISKRVEKYYSNWSGKTRFYSCGRPSQSMNRIMGSSCPIGMPNRKNLKRSTNSDWITWPRQKRPTFVIDCCCLVFVWFDLVYSQNLLRFIVLNILSAVRLTLSYTVVITMMVEKVTECNVTSWRWVLRGRHGKTV